MGNTFIGQNNFFYSPSSKNLLYAPTWEGGIPEENYSSIGDLALNNLIEISVNNNIKNIYIQAHPNLGHRDKKYLVFSKQGELPMIVTDLWEEIWEYFEKNSDYEIL